MLSVILTGGLSRRMGQDKAMLQIEDKSLLQLLIDRYRTLGSVAVSVDRHGRFAFEGALELVDPFPGQGPVNGLIAGFEQTKEAALLLTATDLPFGETGLARQLCALSEGVDACVLRRGVKGREPLFAVYRRPCLPVARACMEHGEIAFGQVLSRLNVRYVLPEEVPEYDLDHVLFNVNTPADLVRMRSCLRENDGV